MKTYLNNSQNNNYISNSMLMRKRKTDTQHNYKKTEITRENKELNRPARAISFGGSAGLTKSLTKGFNKTVEFVYENEAAYNAIYSMIVAGMLKPLFVLNMPGSEEKDKQIVATKNFLQAFIGCFLGYTVGGKFIKKAIDVIGTNFNLLKINKTTGEIEAIEATSAKALEIAKNNIIKEKTTKKFKFKTAKEAAADLSGIKKKIKTFKESYKNAEYLPSIDETSKKAKLLIQNFEDNHIKAFQKNPEFTKLLKNGVENAKSGTSYMEAFNSLWKNSTGSITAIGKAKISTLLLPTVMAFLFAKKNLEKEMQKRAQIEAMTGKLTSKEDEYKQMMKKGNQHVSFKGNTLNSTIDGMASLIEKAAMSPVGEGLAKLLSHSKKPSARMSDFDSLMITGYWLQNTARSKKIEPSQKLGLNVHSALVTAVSSTSAFIIDWALDGLIDKSKDNYKNKLEKITENIKTNPSLEIGETLDATLKDTPDLIKLGIKDKVIALLDTKQTKEGLAQITDNEIKAIVDELSAMESFKDFVLDESIIKKAIDSLKKSEPIRKEVLEQATDLIGAKNIAKEISRTIGDEEALAKSIAKLTKDYGKKLSKFKSLTIFTLVVRFLVPVLMVPFSGKLKKKIIEWTEGKPNKQKNPETQKA